MIDSTRHKAKMFPERIAGDVRHVAGSPIAHAGVMTCFIWKETNGNGTDSRKPVLKTRPQHPHDSACRFKAWSQQRGCSK
jgi:hypothetical protein